MKIRSSLLMGAVLAMLAAGAGIALAQDAPGGGGPGGPGMGGRMGGRGRGGAPASLGAAMQDMNRMVTALKAEASDPTKSAQTLKDLAQFERDVAIAKTMPATPVNGTDAAKGAVDFRNGMNTLLKTALDLEDAVANNKQDVITKDLQVFADTEKAGHAEFRPTQ